MTCPYCGKTDCPKREEHLLRRTQCKRQDAAAIEHFAKERRAGNRRSGMLPDYWFSLVAMFCAGVLVGSGIVFGLTDGVLSDCSVKHNVHACEWRAVPKADQPKQEMRK